jgi:RNA polymerase sigma factor (sigma-70 family)
MEEKNAMPSETELEARPSSGAILLTQFIERNAASLMVILRGYVRKAHIVPNMEEAVQEAALELLDEVYLEAIKTGTHFDSSRPPRAWLLGIANKLVLRKKTEKYSQQQREVHVSDLRQEYQNELSDDDVLDRLTPLVHNDPEQQVIAIEQFEHLLSLVSEDDRQILRLAIERDLDGNLLAQALDCSYNAAMVRLCRARQRLRAALEERKGESNG